MKQATKFKSFLSIKHNDAVLHGHFYLPVCKIQAVTTKCKQTLSLKKELFIHPDVGSELHVTTSQTKIVPPAHVHAVCTVISCTS